MTAGRSQVVRGTVVGFLLVVVIGFGLVACVRTAQGPDDRRSADSGLDGDGAGADRGSADRGSADRGSADQGSADRSVDGPTDLGTADADWDGCGDWTNWSCQSGSTTSWATCADPDGTSRRISCEQEHGGLQCECRVGTTESYCSGSLPEPLGCETVEAALLGGCCAPGG